MKKFKGVISRWKRVDDRIVGIAAYHVDGTTIEAALMSANPGAIANGHRMTTSALVDVPFQPANSDFYIVETRNSYYLLLGEESV